MKRPGQRNPLYLAGWLFADMLLVFALVAMGDQGDPVAAEPDPKPSQSAKPKPKPKPKPKGPRAVERKPVKVSLSAKPSDRKGMVKKLKDVTDKYDGQHAAIVLTFGRSSSPGPGIDYAHRVNSLLDDARPDMFKGTTTRDFMDLGGAVGHADLEIYFYTH